MPVNEDSASLAQGRLKALYREVHEESPLHPPSPVEDRQPETTSLQPSPIPWPDLDDGTIGKYTPLSGPDGQTIRSRGGSIAMSIIAMFLAFLIKQMYVPTWVFIGQQVSSYRKFYQQHPIPVPTGGIKGYEKLQRDLAAWHKDLTVLHTSVANRVRMVKASSGEEDMDVDFGDEMDNIYRSGEEAHSLRMVLRGWRGGEGWFTLFLLLHLVLAVTAHLQRSTLFLFIAVHFQFLILHITLRAAALNAALEATTGAVSRAQLAMVSLVPTSIKEMNALELCMKKCSVVEEHWSKQNFGIKVLIPFTWRTLLVDPVYLTEEGLATAGALLYFLLLRSPRGPQAWWWVYASSLVAMTLVID